MTSLTILFALGGAVLLLLAEWRRQNQRHRALRIAASVAAVAALVSLGVQRVTPGTPQPGAVSAVLLTHSDDAADAPAPTMRDANLHFALPGVTTNSAAATIIPDVAYLRRHFPEVSSVHVFGDGVEPYEVEQLRDLKIAFSPSITAESKPTITFLHVPWQLSLGEPLRLQGAIEGLADGETVTLLVEAPDGTGNETTVTGRAGDAARFELHARAPQAEGRFTWRLRMNRASGDGEELMREIIGVPVVRPNLPQVLVLESSPSFETAHLRRWLAELGGAFTARTTISEARFRFSFAGESPREFTSVDEQLLANFDVLLSDAQTLLGLSRTEQETIRNAIAKQGLGLLAFPSREAAADNGSGLLPWKVEQLEAGELVGVTSGRSARIQWSGLPAPLEQPVGIENMEIVSSPTQSTLVADAQDRPVVTAMRLGSGQLALTLVRDTWRWRLRDHAATFASYWSHLLTRLAKREMQPREWIVAGAHAFPITVDAPVELRLSGATAPPPPVTITSERGGDPVVLPLAGSLVDPGQWQITFWPSHTGWHRVDAQDGTRRDFFVHERAAWESVRRADRRRATHQLAERTSGRSSEVTTTPETAATAKMPHAGILFAVFLLSSGYLWLERRRLT